MSSGFDLSDLADFAAVEHFESDEGALDWLRSIGSGAATGATTGLAAGPWGALIGGIAGAGAGAISQAVSDRQAGSGRSRTPPRPAQSRPASSGGTANVDATLQRLIPILTQLVRALSTSAGAREAFEGGPAEHGLGGHAHAHGFSTDGGLIDRRTGARLPDRRLNAELPGEGFAGAGDIQWPSEASFSTTDGLIDAATGRRLPDQVGTTALSEGLAMTEDVHHDHEAQFAPVTDDAWSDDDFPWFAPESGEHSENSAQGHPL